MIKTKTSTIDALCVSQGGKVVKIKEGYCYKDKELSLFYRSNIITGIIKKISKDNKVIQIDNKEYKTSPEAQAVLENAREAAKQVQVDITQEVRDKTWGKDL